jgi:hypothetical protein
VSDAAKRCPVCDLPPGDDVYGRLDAKVCHMWGVATYGRCTPSWDAMTWCMRRGKDRREQIAALEVEVADLKNKLKAAQGALARHHAKSSTSEILRRFELCVHDNLKSHCPTCRAGHADMFRDDARIE